MEAGWIKLHRRINDHWIWKNSDYLKWWIDILIEVNHAEQKVLIKNKVLICSRGEKVFSLETWAKRWGTNKNKVKRFFDLLEKDNMIVLKSETVTTRLTVCNYVDYQGIENGFDTQVKRKRNASETQVNSIEECNNTKNNISVDWDGLLNQFNQITGRSFRVVDEKTKTQIKARLKDGYSKADILRAIKNCFSDEYHKETNHKYLTLEFISRSDKMAKYSTDINKQIKKPNREIGML